MLNNPEQLRPWLVLTLTAGLGVRTFKRLTERFGSPEAVLKGSRSELIECGVESEIIRQLHGSELARQADAELQKAEQAGVHILTWSDERYPLLLKEIFDAPPIIYVRGRVEILTNRPTIAIVGTRTPTPYGIHVAETLARDLTRAGVSIISGLARGVDTAAHRGALEAEGSTVAVLGSGVDVIYPRENKKIADRIAATGAMISEFPLNTYPAPQNFPIRNRIISGLSLGCTVVEAAEHSGSLITARMALEQNREVFAVPGPITGSKSFGPNFLIKQGAKLVQNWRDIIEELVPPLRDDILRRVDGAAPVDEKLPPITTEEHTVFNLLSVEQPTHIDHLVSATQMQASILSERLLTLEMKGLIKQLPGKNFVRK